MAKSPDGRQRKLDYIYEIRELYEQIVREQQCVSLRTLAVNGKDLIRMGMKPGKEIGEMLNFLLEKVLDEPDYNKKEYLMTLARRRLDSLSR